MMIELCKGNYKLFLPGPLEKSTHVAVFWQVDA